MHFKRKLYCLILSVILCVIFLFATSRRTDIETHNEEPSYYKLIYSHAKHMENMTGLLKTFYYHNISIKDLQLQTQFQGNASVRRVPILTLFTSFKPSSERTKIHENVLMNWILFKPFVRPVLYLQEGTDSKLELMATSLGWDVMPCPETNPYGTPVLEAMYQKTVATYSSMLYGYCNGDILFEFSLLDTLKSVIEIQQELGKVMIIGQRTNFLVENRTVFHPRNVKSLQEKEGSLFQTDAEDYFFISPPEFPWDKIPKLVIGRMGYDNYFVSKAAELGYTLIDATETLIALHQTGADGNYAGHGKSIDRLYNYRLIGEGTDISKGVTVVAVYKTKWNKKSVEVWHRIIKADPRLYKLKARSVQEIQYLDDSLLNY